jgi:hypothetical protein
MNVEEVVVGPFHSSTAPLQVALLVLQQLKGRYTHINPQFHKGFTHLLSFLLHFWTGAVSLFLFINTHVEQLFQRKKFESANNNTILLWPFTVDKWSKRARNYIIKSYLDIL